MGQIKLKIIKNISLSIVSMWLGMTALVDFVAVPTLFRNISNLEEAGNVGMIIFSSFNKIELFFILLIIGLGLSALSEIKFKKIFISIWGLLLLVAGSYNFYLTPKIIEVQKQMREIGMQGAGFESIERVHNFYHSLYIQVDSVKLLLLLILLVAGIKPRREGTL